MNENVLDALGISFSAFLTASQTNETFRLISLILTILATLVVLARNIYDWYIRSKRDGKIDKEEIKDLVDIVGNGIEKIDNTIKGDKQNGNSKKD